MTVSEAIKRLEAMDPDALLVLFDEEFGDEYPAVDVSKTTYKMSIKTPKPSGSNVVWVSSNGRYSRDLIECSAVCIS